jgi:hypothetical protein
MEGMTVKALFDLPIEELLPTWRDAKLIELDLRTLERHGPNWEAYEKAKLATQLIRLVISFRLNRPDSELAP